jgi:hypothetical protein
MDVSFEPSFGGGSGWDGDAITTSTQAHGATSSFDRVPLPVQVNDVLRCQTDDDKVHLGGYAFGTLRVCGRILSKTEQDKETQLEICDPTEMDTDMCDRLPVIVYQSANKGSVEYNENDIIVALGKIRKFDGLISFVAFGITVQEDKSMTDIFKLEAQLAKYFYEKNVPERVGQGPCQDFEGTMFSNIPFVRGNQSSGAGIAAVAGGAQQSTPYQYNQYGGNQSTSVTTSTKDSVSYSDSNRGLSGLRQKIFEHVRSAASNGDAGVNVNDILRAVGPNAPNFHNELQYLVNEGVLYNTIDDDHFAAI